MPFNSNSGGGGPWGGGNRGGKSPWGGGSGGGGGGQGPDLDDLLRRGRDQLKVVLGGGGGGGGRGRGGGGRGPASAIGPYLPIIVPVVAAGIWALESFYVVSDGERSVELFLGEFSNIGEPGLNFAPWPFVTYDILPVARQNVIDIGVGSGRDQGLMLTGDENIIDIEFQVVWNITNPEQFLFSLAEPVATIQAVSASAMREVIGRSEMKPILNRDRGIISQEVQALIQSTLDSYQSGVNIVRVNFDRADPPAQVIEAFRDVQAAAQDRETEQNRAEAYANQKLAEARGQVAQINEEAIGYKAQQVNQAIGEAARFSSVLTEYLNAPDVTRQRLYIETMERVLGQIDKVIIDESVGNGGAAGGGGSGVVPYLPLTELNRNRGTN